MRILPACFAGALLAIPAALLGYATPPPGKSGPPVVPYLCHGGHEAVAIYESGSDFQHATAKITYEGRTIELRAAPTLYGVRYRGEGESGSALAWTLRGEEAWLTESPDEDSYAGDEPAIARCVRVRGVMPYAAAYGSHGDDH
jgi:hypothetical protein